MHITHGIWCDEGWHNSNYRNLNIFYRGDSTNKVIRKKAMIGGIVKIARQIDKSWL